MFLFFQAHESQEDLLMSPRWFEFHSIRRFNRTEVRKNLPYCSLYGKELYCLKGFWDS